MYKGAKRKALDHSYIGIDQYGDTYPNLEFPRKSLLERLDRKSAFKIYIDDKDGNTKHVGYLVAGRWVTIYKITPWEGRKLRGGRDD